MVLLAALLLFTQPLQADDVTGTILGIVTDPTGAVVPAAKVTLRNPNTGLARVTATDVTGTYQFLYVPVADGYAVETEVKGFRKTTQTGIKLLVNQRFRADFQLQVGETRATVTVSANNAQVETVSTQLGDVIEDRKMTDLPLNGRSYLDLLGLQAGVAGGGASVAVNGQRQDQNSFQVNGGFAEDVYYNVAAIVPTLDSIQEFRLLTNSFDAEYGHFSGAVVNAITKSGSNSLHGDVYEFLRNEDLNARNFYETDQTNPLTGAVEPGTARGLFRRNQFGFTVGGAILKDRLFFFSDYQGTRQIQGSAGAGLLSVPSATERGGDFSDVATTGYNALTGAVRGDDVTADGAMPTVLSNRLGYTVSGGEPYWVSGCNTAADAQAGTCVFPGQVIPQAAWGPVAKATLKFVPPPTTFVNGHPYYFTSALNTRTRDDKWAQRIDFVNQRTGNWTFYYNFDDTATFNPAYVQDFGYTAPVRAQQLTMSNTRNIGPSTVNELRLNYTRFLRGGNILQNGPVSISTYGFIEGGLGLIPGNPSQEGLPEITLGLLGLSFGAPVSEIFPQNAFQGMETLSKILGKHTLKLGGGYRYIQWDRHGGTAANGSFQFYGGETGNDFADFLLGAPDGFEQSSRQMLDARMKGGEAFVQDSYRVRSNFTLNYGLRWEFEEPWYDTQDRIQQFIPGQQSTKFPNSPTGWVFPGDTGIPRTLAPTPYRDFAPRLGFAYSPQVDEGVLNKILGGPGKTSIRAAAGIFYSTMDTMGSVWSSGDAPFAIFYTTPVPIYLEEPYKSRINGNDPGQRFPFTGAPGTGSDISFAQFLPISYSTAYQISNKTPYGEDFNVTIQRQIGTTSVFTLGYVGTMGHHLFAQLEYNPGNAARCLQIAQLYSAAGQGGGCGPYGEDSIYSIDGQTFNGTRPYSVTSGRYLSQGLLDFGDQSYESTLANSSYNSLQATFEKKLGAVRFLGAYTWSKSLDNSSQFLDLVNPFNPRLSRSLSSYDETHNFVVSYTYDLPLARLTSAHSGFLHGFLDGWVVAGITHYNTGFPISMLQSGDLALCNCGGGGNESVNFPNYSGQPIQFFNPRKNAEHRYFSADAFSSEQLGVPGNANRRFFHGPDGSNWDMSLYKRTRINERVSMDIRAEFFGLFNHPVMGCPVSDYAAGSSFGEVTCAGNNRIGQVAAKLHF
jgi:hypothetical protein